jgi:hypothetical protein
MTVAGAVWVFGFGLIVALAIVFMIDVISQRVERRKRRGGK